VIEICSIEYLPLLFRVLMGYSILYMRLHIFAVKINIF